MHYWMERTLSQSCLTAGCRPDWGTDLRSHFWTGCRAVRWDAYWTPLWNGWWSALWWIGLFPTLPAPIALCTKPYTPLAHISTARRGYRVYSASARGWRVSVRPSPVARVFCVPAP